MFSQRINFGPSDPNLKIKTQMENTAKYLLLRLEERNGEYEYIHRSVHALADGEAATVNIC
ncbi:MAG: hypothetical protein IPM96_00825 [Ignavibacteria bacterium]|nr:hypothetical protein [Ignavibacteria bacterium]